MECGGRAPLWSNREIPRPQGSVLRNEAAPDRRGRKRRQAAAGQSGARPPHSKEEPLTILLQMRRKVDIRKGRLVAAVLEGVWRDTGYSRLEVTERELDEVTPLLCSSGSAALAWYRIRNTHLQNSSSAEVLHQSFRLQSLQTAIHEEKVEKVFRLLRAASVEAILAKGWAAAGFYSNRDLRPCGDIDICVRPADFQVAHQVLNSPEASDCWVDLHEHFFEIGERSVDDLFARSTTVSLGQEQIRILSLEDHLAFLCIHLLKHGAWRPLWLCDIAAAVESLPATFDWQVFIGNNPRRASWIAAALGLAHRLLGARIEHLPLEETQTEVPEWMAEAVLLHWATLFPADHLPVRPPPLMVNNLSSGRKIVKGVIERWPDPITATFNMGGEFNNFPRWPYQVADFFRMTTRYLRDLPTKLQAHHPTVSRSR